MRMRTFSDFSANLLVYYLFLLHMLSNIYYFAPYRRRTVIFGPLGGILCEIITALVFIFHFEKQDFL